MSNATSDRRFVPLRALAATLNLPAAWLRREADEGRLPCLRAGRRRMFDPAAVTRILDQRAGDATPANTAEARP